jgi:hypothetical protein
MVAKKCANKLFFILYIIQTVSELEEDSFINKL